MHGCPFAVQIATSAQALRVKMARVLMWWTGLSVPVLRVIVDDYVTKVSRECSLHAEEPSKF